MRFQHQSMEQRCYPLVRELLRPGARRKCGSGLSLALHRVGTNTLDHTLATGVGLRSFQAIESLEERSLRSGAATLSFQGSC